MTFILSFVLVGKFRLRGAANAYLIAMLIEFIIYGGLTMKCLNTEEQKEHM